MKWGNQPAEMSLIVDIQPVHRVTNQVGYVEIRDRGSEDGARPACKNRPYEKSFSSVSWPIFACSSFKSTCGSLDAVPPAPNTSATRSCNYRFHSVIWFGRTSNCCANSASVCSPLTAAIATFALNAAKCVRLVLFVVSKVPLSALSPPQAPSVPFIRLS